MFHTIKLQRIFKKGKYRRSFAEVSNLCSALTAYCFFENKPEALPVYAEKSRQLELFSC